MEWSEEDNVMCAYIWLRIVGPCVDIWGECAE